MRPGGEAYMVFYRIGNRAEEIGIDDIREDFITVGYVTAGELKEIYPRFGFDSGTVEDSQVANTLFRTGAEVHSEYTFTELRVVTDSGEDDWISVYMNRNFLLVTDIRDSDGSTRDGLLRALEKIQESRLKMEKLICLFFDLLLEGSHQKIETMRNAVAEMEESVVTDSAKKEFGIELMTLKKKLLKLQNYYEQILDVMETLEENDNGIFEEGSLIYFSNYSRKVERLRNDTNSLNDAVDHLQDAYSSFLDVKLNRTMKVLTVITTVFFPLTIIVGWYGMNFQSMPEFTWKYGYVYVIFLSVAVAAVLAAIAKKHKWF